MLEIVSKDSSLIVFGTLSWLCL